MKFSISLERFGLAFILVAAAIFGGLTSAQEDNNLAFATIVPIEPLEPRPDSTEDSQEDEEGEQEERGQGRDKEKKEKDKKGDDEEDSPNTEDFVPVVISGDNVYLTWWTNTTGNDEVMFRSSTDGGASFGDKINLSNSTNANSTKVEIAGEGDNVLVSWWETNQTSDTPIVRVSTDAGQTFGPILRLATNGTIGEAAEAEGD
jgi:hypothetical protein